MPNGLPYDALKFSAASHQRLIQYSMSRQGRAFGTEFTGMWLYSLLRMQGGRNVLELGTGYAFLERIKHRKGYRHHTTPVTTTEWEG